MPIRKSLLDAVADYLEASGPNDQNEWGMHCPLHEDHNRSSSLNIDTGEWYCFTEQKGMHISELVAEMKRRGTDSSSRTTSSTSRRSDNRTATSGGPSLGTVKGWAAALLADKERLRELRKRRGLNKETIKNFDIGWSRDDEAYTIPVYGTDGKSVRNVRFYRFDVPEGRRKIWSVAGSGSPDLYPAQLIDSWDDVIVVCEGEWDCLLTIQQGFDCVTRTGAAGVWRSTWNNVFENKVVFLCHDMDTAGQKANVKVAAQLKKIAKEVHTLLLPYEITESHGRDLTDFWLEGYQREDFIALMATAMGDVDLTPEVAEDMEAVEPVDVTVLDTFNSENTGKPVGMRATITGKRFPTWLLPADVKYSCDCEAPKCPVCPMNDETGGWAGDHRQQLNASDAIILEMVEKNSDQVLNLLRVSQGIQKCPKLVTTIKSSMSVEEIFIRPSVDTQRFSTEPGDYTTRRVISVGRHDTMPNNTVELVGCVRPNPSNQRNELQAWKVEKTETSIDKFEMTPTLFRKLKKFQPRRGQRPLAKMYSIADDLSAHVTRIYERDAMHVVMDLSWHSVLALPYNGALLERGWLDILVIGDTRTGKSEAAQKLLRHYQAGEFISCEAASFAGIVGGLQQHDSREWTVTWGAIPLNDRRLVALDEVSGLTTDQIAQMSSIRSSGEAQLTKVRQERTFARTRLLWLGNPRNGANLADHAFGVRAILPLIGNNEDVARFDLVMCVDKRTVKPEAISRDYEDRGPQVYGTDVCSALVLWAWSRKPEHIKWETGAEKLCHTLGMELGKKYMSDPPLIQSANVRIKIARLAAAIAARTFSTPDGEQLLINKAHVEDAVRIIQDVYDAPEFGYGSQSAAISRDIEIALASWEPAKNIIKSIEGLYEFFRDAQTFCAKDLEDVLHYSREQAQAIFNDLWNFRMAELVSGEGFNKQYKQSTVMQDLVREIGAEQ